MMANFNTLIFFVHLSVLCMGSLRNGWPGYEHYPELQGWLKVHQEPADWKTARTNCHNEDALLASPWTPEFTTTIEKLLSTKYPILYSGAGLRTGSSGLQMEPCDNKRCFTFSATGSSTDKVHCKTQLPYACYARELSCGDQYVFNARTGQCYKFHTEGASVPDAKSTCQAEGGYLAKISDDTEKAVFQTMAVGLTFINNDDDGPAYRHLTSSGYTDYACTGPHPFICEKTKSNFGSDFRD